MILVSILFFDVLNLSEFGNSILHKQWSTSMSVQTPGPLGYHAVEATKTFSKALSNKTNKTDKELIEQWLNDNNDGLKPNEYQGYTTISTHAEMPGEFNWTELHKNGFGAQKLCSLEDYNYDEAVGYGLSDRSFLTQLSEKIKDIKQPFFIQAPTLSSHGPFNIAEKYRSLQLPSEIDKSYLGGYFESVHYTDEQIKMFFSQLKKYNLLDNTVVVLYGDHSGVHKYYNDDIQKLDYEDNWWKQYDHKIPLIIYSPNIKSATIKTFGGQVDILPTISYLLGIDESLYKNTSMGRVLVNTNKNATVTKGNIILGNVKSEEEKQHLLNAYSIGEKIIKNNFFAQP